MERHARCALHRRDKEFYGRQRDRNALAFNLGLPLELHPDPSDPTLYFPPGKLEQDFSNTSIRLGTEYSFSDDVFVYASYAEGFKSGGWDTRLTAPDSKCPDSCRKRPRRTKSA